MDGGESYTGPYWLFLVNRAGQVVWYHEVGFWVTMFPRAAGHGGYVAFDRHSLLDATGEYSTVTKMTLDGTRTEEIATPGLGWCWDETDDGSLLYDRNKGVAEVTIEELSPDGTSRTIWDCAAWQATWDPDKENCYTNTINWVPETDSILWSTYWGDWVAEVDRQSGDVLWHAGALPDGWTIDADAGFDLQHYPNYTPDGTLLVSTHVPGQDEQQRAREFVVDHASQALTEVWAYGEGVEGYAQYSGEAVRLDNGNTLLNYGTGGEIREVDPRRHHRVVARVGRGSYARPHPARRRLVRAQQRVLRRHARQQTIPRPRLRRLRHGHGWLHHGVGRPRIRGLLRVRLRVLAGALPAAVRHGHRGLLLRRLQEQRRLRPLLGGAQDLGCRRQREP